MKGFRFRDINFEKSLIKAVEIVKWKLFGYECKIFFIDCNRKEDYMYQFDILKILVFELIKLVLEIFILMSRIKFFKNRRKDSVNASTYIV
jgi:uncharacterized protein with PQ loop repeat